MSYDVGLFWHHLVRVRFILFFFRKTLFDVYIICQESYYVGALDKLNIVWQLKGVTSVNSCCFWLLLAKVCFRSDRRSHCEKKKQKKNKQTDKFKRSVLKGMPNACLSCLSQLKEDASFFPWEDAHAKHSKGVLLSTRAYACILLARLSLAEIIFHGPHDDSQSTRYAEVLPFSKVHLYWFPASIAGIN